MFDLDGTILSGGDEVSPRVIEALRQARGCGTILAVASGRPIGMVPATLRHLGIMDYYICTNGATVYDAGGTRLLDAGMPSSVAEGIVWALKPLGPAWNAFVDGRGFIEVKNTTYLVASRARAASLGGGSLSRRVRRGVRLLLGRGDFTQVASIGPTIAAADTVEKLGCSFGTAEDAYDAARLLTDVGLEVAVMGGRELEVTAPGVTKGSGAAWLITHLDIDASRTVAFGDGGNDASLARAVGTLVAMGNADVALKEVADLECGDVADDGVATWLEDQIAEASHGGRTTSAPTGRQRAGMHPPKKEGFR